MAARKTFGRRQPPTDSRPAGLAATLGSEAEAFRATLRSERGADPDAFSAWLRGWRGRRMLVWIGGAALLAPGLICLVLQAPGWVCVTCEVAGVFANAWLRRERRRQLKAITGWDAGDAGAD